MGKINRMLKNCTGAIILFLVTESLCAKPNTKFGHQIDFYGNYRTILYTRYDHSYPKFHQTRLAYLPTITWDTQFTVSAVIGGEMDVFNQRNVLHYIRNASVVYGAQLSYSFRLKENYSIQSGLQINLFNDFVYGEFNKTIDRYRQNGFETILFLGPNLPMGRSYIMPKINFIYRKRDRFRYTADEQQLFIHLGTQVSI